MSFENTEKLLIELNSNVISAPYESGDISNNYLKKYFNNKDKECNMEIEFFSGLNIADSFANEYELNNKNNIYTSVCDLETYKLTYYGRLQDFFDEIPDAGEHYFIYTEIIDVERKFNFPFVDEKTSTKIFHSSLRKHEFLSEKMKALGYETYIENYDENGSRVPESTSYRKTENFKPGNLVIPMKLNIFKKEMAELFKALHVSGVINGTQKDGWAHFCKLFGEDDKYLHQTVQENKTKSNKTSDTPFLNRLISSYLNLLRK